MPPKKSPKKPSGGRKPLGLRRRPIGLREEQWQWLTKKANQQGGTVDAWLRNYIAAIMAEDGK